MNKQSDPTILRLVFRAYNKEIFHEWKTTFTIFASVVVGSILIFYTPALVIAKIIASKTTIDLTNGWGYLALFGASWLTGELLWRFSFFLMAKFEARTLERLYATTLDELVHKDVLFFSDRFAGSITKNVLAYARRFESYFDTLAFGIISQVVPAIFGHINQEDS